MSQYANPSTYEQQNDESLNRLFNKVHSLRQVTINIHSDADQQRSLIDDTSSAADRFATSLRSTANKLSSEVVRYSRSHRLTTYIVGAFVLLWLLWYFFL
ncbi:hypothetical protein GLX27_002750 [Malassezia furfur]|uniref:t-SNARE coiled-coil homology domain-containing protein n=1 Tax=Malassezia furfur TaxID=55194 RepID=A0ABY8ER88_MALFU|nr:hypothetical protein CBS14141_002421 [Malassezia furfur]WFD48082.1 hypothetical protein GLX27_002750 [Malassezia furfur]